MRKIALVGFVVFLLFASTAHAQMIQNVCNIQSGVSNTVEGSDTKVKMDYNIRCGAESYEGQITRMLIRVPYTGIDNLEVEDKYGTMKVLEGPSYYSVTADEDESVIGVIFRSGLQIAEEPTSYNLAIEFDTGSLVTEYEETYTIKPGGLAANPKLTIVSDTGVTESTTVVGSYDYVLEFKDSISVSTVPNMCSLNENKVSCNNMAGTVMDDIEVKWTVTGGAVDGISEWIQEYTGDIWPGIQDALGGIWGSISERI